VCTNTTDPKSRHGNDEIQPDYNLFPPVTFMTRYIWGRARCVPRFLWWWKANVRKRWGNRKLCVCVCKRVNNFVDRAKRRSEVSHTSRGLARRTNIKFDQFRNGRKCLFQSLFPRCRKNGTRQQEQHRQRHVDETMNLIKTERSSWLVEEDILYKTNE